MEPTIRLKNRRGVILLYVLIDWIHTHNNKPISKIQPVVTKSKPIWKQAKKEKDPKEKPPEVAPVSSIDLLGKGKNKNKKEAKK